MSAHTKALPPLIVGSRVFVQNQNKTSKQFKKWDRTGTIREAKDHDQYTVSIDGTGRHTTRNRQFLRAFQESPCDAEQLRLSTFSPPTTHNETTEETHATSQTTPDPTPDTNNDQPQNTILSEHELEVPEESPVPVAADPQPETSLRKSVRVRKDRLFYNPEDGTYGPAQS